MGEPPIVRFVADVEPNIPLAEIDAVPPLLSLLCAELNEQRLPDRESVIRPEQLKGRAEDILETAGSVQIRVAITSFQATHILGAKSELSRVQQTIQSVAGPTLMCSSLSLPTKRDVPPEVIKRRDSN